MNWLENIRVDSGKTKGGRELDVKTFSPVEVWDTIGGRRMTLIDGSHRNRNCRNKSEISTQRP